ncbi:triose-phosphate isomerase [Aquimarina sp. W85]|uniref:triose-phosphate isomerase n=1 Tax=Aquimarina rhodophyticola TaxID=3342246 RepID=UPI00366B4846
MRKRIVAGNWKMNKSLPEAGELIADIKAELSTMPEAEIIIAPAFTNLYYSFELLKGTGIKLAAQNMNAAAHGAYTGEISAEMLKSIGVNTVILGHSERRTLFGEADKVLAAKVTTALDQEMRVIFCFGEELKDRKAENHFECVQRQLEKGLFHIKKEHWKSVILAYEPVWAIGTGETATPQQAQEMHNFIRETVAKHAGDTIADNVSILYGGSVKPTNAKELFSNKDVDGGLIGGAALDAKSFVAIANSF